MNVLGSIFARRPSRDRPDLASWIAGAEPALVVDGGAWGASFPGVRLLVHETSGGPGLPFFDRDPRRLPVADGALAALVLADVLDKVIDVGFALDEARRALTPGGLLLLVDAVAPEDFEERAIWNALAHMRDARHAWTPSARQSAAVLSGLKMAAVRETEWEETLDPRATSRPEAAESLATMTAAAVARGAAEVVRDGQVVVVRRATLLRRA